MAVSIALKRMPLSRTISTDIVNKPAGNVKITHMLNFKKFFESNNLSDILKNVELYGWDRDDRTIVRVKVKEFDRAWKKDKNFYIGKYGTANSIGDRYERFKAILDMPKDVRKKQFYQSKSGNMVASSVGVDAEGRPYFDNGRHRYAVLRDLGVKRIPVAMTKESIKNAKAAGYI
jgi:hypothetical protein